MNEINKEASLEKKPLTVPEQQDSSTYIGLLLGGIILATGAIVLFGDLYSTFGTKGIDITIALIFRMGLMLVCAYGAISCFFALYRIASLNRMLSKKIGEEFEDFVLYTRPFIEEVIRQRLAVEKVIDKLEVMEKRNIESASSRDESQNLTTKWWEFLFFVALLTNISIGLYVYLEAHPYEMVPYSVIILGIAWWILMAKYFDLLFDPRGIYIPAFFIAFLPTVSIVLQIILAPYQALFVVFLVLFFYVAATYYYYKFLTTGIPLFSITKFREEIKASKKARIEKTSMEIHMKKESVLEQILYKMKEELKEKTITPPVIETPQEIVVYKINLKEVITTALRTKMQRFLQSFKYLIWPQVLCRNGRKISIAGFIMVSIGIVTTIAFPGTYENLFLEAIFVGIILMAAGYSLIWKTGKKVFAWVTLLYLISIIMSLGSIINFFHLLTLISIEAEIQNIALVYIIGIIFLVVDIIIGKRYKHLAVNE